MAGTLRRVGILGGTFDPVHFGHLRIAEEAAEALRFDKLLFIPAADPPHKTTRRILCFAMRWQMLQLALEGNPRFALSNVERNMPGKSFTVRTLHTLLQGAAQKTQFYLLVGLDSFLELDAWWHFRELFQLAQMVVLRRPGYDEHDVETFLKQKISGLYEWDAMAALFRHPQLLDVHFLKSTEMDISSTRIRDLVAAGRSIRYLVPDKVMGYIYEKELYRAGEGRADRCGRGCKTARHEDTAF